MKRGMSIFLFAILTAAFTARYPIAGWAQGVERKPPTVQRGQETLQRGIEKNVRVVVLYDANDVPEAHAAAVARSLSEKSLTRVLQAVTPPTARSSGSPLPAPNQVIFISARQNAGGGDCDKPGCLKNELGCFCFELLDYDKTILSTFPIDTVPPPKLPPNLSKGSSTGSPGGGRLMSQPGIVVVVMGDTFSQKLASREWRKRNQKWLEKEVWSKIKASPLKAITIKQKSPPR